MPRSPSGSHPPIRGDSIVFIVGLGAGVGGAAVTMVIGASEAFTAFQVVVSGCVVFLVGAVATLLVEVRRRADNREGFLGILDGLSSSSEAVAAYRGMGSALGAVLDGYRGQQEITIAWQTAMEKCRQQLDNLRNGFLLVRSDDPTYKTALLSRGLSLRTTSLVRFDLEFWLSPEGETYWLEQVAALRKGQSIERVFIVDRESDAVKALVQRHADAGVTCWVVPESGIAQGDRVDIALWQDEVVFQQRVVRVPAVSGPEYDRLCMEPVEVKKAVLQFERILSSPLIKKIDPADGTSPPPASILAQ